MCAFFWSTDGDGSGLFPLFSKLKISHKRLKSLTLSHGLGEKYSGVHPGESLERDDMTYHSRVYQISFWQIRPVWGGTLWWWERLWSKIGQRALRDVWAGGVYCDCVYRNVCCGYLSVCLCMTTAALLIFLGIGRSVKLWTDWRELYTAKKKNGSSGNRFN